jgi:hypothetical protein
MQAVGGEQPLANGDKPAFLRKMARTPPPLRAPAVTDDGGPPESSVEYHARQAEEVRRAFSFAGWLGVGWGKEIVVLSTPTGLSTGMLLAYDHP